ncbi:hypothetical protein CQW23_22591 [Capsicum baccatum]|uniref:Uncharacterized protein n=1 Tax=Capsicum baccatum TaxID=33114 RepID=A0A2G2W1B3_CAPBA|nr:hypothetical protein CQW23_22591 [Capsicum baccatum]
MSMNLLITTLAILAFFESQLAYAYDLHPLQDICVAVKDPNISAIASLERDMLSECLKCMYALLRIVRDVHIDQSSIGSGGATADEG